YPRARAFALDEPRGLARHPAFERHHAQAAKIRLPRRSLGPRLRAHRSYLACESRAKSTPARAPWLSCFGRFQAGGLALPERRTCSVGSDETAIPNRDRPTRGCNLAAGDEERTCAESCGASHRDADCADSRIASSKEHQGCG